MKRLVVCVLVLLACTKTRTSDPPSSSGSAATIAPAPAPLDAQITAMAPEPDADADRQYVGVEAIEDPVPVTSDENPGAALNAQLGGSATPAQGGRSLVVVKSKIALDVSTLGAGKMMHEFVRKGQASVKRCFEDLRAKDPSAKGVLTLRFAVDLKGVVVDAEVDGFNAEVVSCVRSAMSAWTFIAPDKPTRFELVLDLVIG